MIKAILFLVDNSIFKIKNKYLLNANSANESFKRNKTFQVFCLGENNHISTNIK